MGSQGGLRLDPFTFFSNIHGIDGNTTFDLNGFEYRQNAYDPNWAGYSSSQQHWVWAVLGRVPQIRTDLIGVRVCEITEMMYKSAEQHRELRAK